MSDLEKKVDRTVDDLYEAMREIGRSTTYQSGYLDALLDLANSIKAEIHAREARATEERENLAGKVIPLRNEEPVTIEDIVLAVEEGLRRNRVHPTTTVAPRRFLMRQVIA